MFRHLYHQNLTPHFAICTLNFLHKFLSNDNFFAATEEAETTGPRANGQQQHGSVLMVILLMCLAWLFAVDFL